MSDRTQIRPTLQQRVQRKARHGFRGDVDGRVSGASAVPTVDAMKYPGTASFEVFVQPDEPDTDTVGALWFDTDEPVP